MDHSIIFHLEQEREAKLRRGREKKLTEERRAEFSIALSSVSPFPPSFQHVSDEIEIASRALRLFTWQSKGGFGKISRGQAFERERSDEKGKGSRGGRGETRGSIRRVPPSSALRMPLSLAPLPFPRGQTNEVVSTARTLEAGVGIQPRARLDQSTFHVLFPLFLPPLPFSSHREEEGEAMLPRVIRNHRLTHN